MPRPTKSELIMEMARLGEVPPKDWTMVEISARLDELRAEVGLGPFNNKKEKTPLRRVVIALNEAAKKKSTLVEFAEKQMQVAVNHHETIATLQKACLLKAYQVTEATGADPVGFGKHSSLSYLEVQQEHPEYSQWVIKTMMANLDGMNCDVRLARLGHWLQRQQNLKDQKSNAITREPVPMTTLVEKGLLRNKIKTMTEGSPTSSGSGSVTSAQLMATQNMTQSLAGLVGDLKEEVIQWKQERPRKEVKKEEDMSSTASFSVIGK